MLAWSRLSLSALLIFSIQWLYADDIYFPASDDAWEKVNPTELGWDADLLSEALDVAAQRDSSGVLILHNGRIMAERYWDVSNASVRYQNFVSGVDSKGRVIEDVASAQKNVVALLIGMAQQRGYLKLDDPASKYLGTGWSKATVEQEGAITIRHIMSMNSGLGTDFSYQAGPNTRWLYNTPVYHVLMRILSTATGLDRHMLTSQWITAPLGMDNSSWTPRPWASADIAVGFSTTARELARFGLMIQAGGRWHEQQLLDDSGYMQEMLTPSQSLNPSYGLLWWLNGQEFSLGAGPVATRKEGPLIAAAPTDLLAMQGALDRKLYLVPSLNLVVTRLGAAGGDDFYGFNEAFWQALMKAAPTR